MKFSIRHQENYSRGELLLRSFFGFLYIAIPHSIVLMFLGLGAAIISFIAFWAILFTGKYPKNMFDYMVKVSRWGMRVRARLMNLSDGYPAFGMDAEDSNVVFDVPYPETVSRGLTLVRMFFGFFYVLIPHGICLLFMMIGAQFCVLIAWFVVLFTGKYPKGMHDYVVGVLRWANRVGIYMNNMTDTYPPFSGKETDPVNWNEAKKIEDHLVD